MKQKPLIIGQAAAKNGAPQALFPVTPGSSGERLLSMSGLSLKEFLSKFEFMNTIEEYPGPSGGRGDAFSMAEGRKMASSHTVRLGLHQRVVLFVGKSNATCYDWGPDGMPAYPFKPREHLAGGVWYWIPHTSGTVKFWNLGRNRAKMPVMFEEILNGRSMT